MATRKIRSLGPLQEFVKARGEEEGVLVLLGSKLERLCDAPAMVRLLKEKMELKGWVVPDFPKLQPLVAVARAVNNASRRTVDVTNLVTANIVMNFRKHNTNKDRAIAKMEKAGEELCNTNVEFVQRLGEAIKEAAEDALKNTKTRAQISTILISAREHCARVYNRKVKLSTAE